MRTLAEDQADSKTQPNDDDARFAKFEEAGRQLDARWDALAGPQLAARRRHLWKRFCRLRYRLEAVEASSPDSWSPRVKFIFCEGPFRICVHESAIPIWPHSHLLYVMDHRTAEILALRKAKELVLDRIIDVQERAEKRAHTLTALHQQNQILRGFLAPKSSRRGRGSRCV